MMVAVSGCWTPPGRYATTLLLRGRDARERSLHHGDHEIVAMHHLGAAGNAEDRENVCGRASADLLGVLRVVGNQATADLHSIRSANHNSVPAREGALD